MSINATYAINEYIKTAISNALSVGITFYPGEWAPQNPGDNFIVYNVLPSTDFQFFMVHTDQIKYKIYNTNFDTLNKMVGTILTTLNVDNIRTNPLSESGITYMMTFVKPTGTSQAIYIEGNNYYVINLDITAVYKENN